MIKIMDPIFMPDFGFGPKPENPKAGDMWLETHEDGSPKLMMMFDPKDIELWKSIPGTDKKIIVCG